MKKVFKIYLGVIFGAVLLLPANSYAAKLYITPPSTIIGIGEKITVDVKIDGEGAGFNGGQATISFPKEILEVSSVDKSSSAFNFWLEEPNFSNSNGVVSFIGGTPYGVSGSSVQVLKIVFTAKGVGNAELTFNDTAVTASDGSGTNILSRFVNAFINVSPTKITTEQIKEVQQIEPIKQIVREPTIVKNLPVAPVLDVSLYPNGEEWYNIQSIFNVKWDLPLDVSGVSTAINKNPKSASTQKSEGLFDSKTFDFLKDGIWYLHANFRNNVGWGPVTHRRIAIDTQPPLGFDVAVLEGVMTDNPTPTLQFKTDDALSGIKEYDLRIDAGDLIKISADDFNGTYKLPLQAPGRHRVVVKALDRAGNGIENSIDIDVTPIASPVITFVTGELFSGEEKGLAVKGTSLADIDVLLTLYQNDVVIDKGIARSDGNGSWEFVFSRLLKNGTYFVRAQNQDSRGALSLTVDSEEIVVKTKPVIQVGKLQVGAGGALLVLIAIMALGFGGGFMFYKKRQEKIGLRVSTARIDFDKMLKIIKDDIKKIEQFKKTPSEVDDKFIFEKIEEDMRKMEVYLKKEIDKIKD